MMSCYYDEVHRENIQFSPLVQSIINTELFQRLKGIKQLGLATYYFSNANHTRYDHSIGTFLVSKKMIKYLEENSNITIPEFYVKCVSIAGLLHDIGHGPFSHLWENVAKDKYDHEKNCIYAIDKIFDSIDDKLSDKNDEHIYGIELIKAFILGDKFYLRRPIDQGFAFLFEIVHNSECDIDVDKWDYLKRDYHHAERYLKHVNLNMDFEGVFQNARVSDDRLHIEYNRRNYENICNLFDARYKMHVHLYQNPNIKIRDKLLGESIALFLQIGCTFKGLNILKITSKNEEFISLVDNEVMSALRNTKNEKINDYINYIQNGTLEEIEKFDLVVRIKIENPGEKMKEEKIRFYGDDITSQANLKRGYYEQIIIF